MKRIALLLLVFLAACSTGNTHGTIAAGGDPIGTVRPKDSAPATVAPAVETPPTVAQEGGPDFKVGDWWEYHATQGPKDGPWVGRREIKEITPNRVIWALPANGKLVTDRYLNVIERTTAAGYVSGSPYVPDFQFPLKVGAKWEARFSYKKTAPGVQWWAHTLDGMGVVEGVETVSVPAGTFQAYRIKFVMRSNYWTGGSTCWYAEETRSWVKCVSSGKTEDRDFELTAYGRAEASASKK